MAEVGSLPEVLVDHRHDGVTLEPLVDSRSGGQKPLFE
jgi:hypothetical protein